VPRRLPSTWTVPALICCTADQRSASSWSCRSRSAEQAGDLPGRRVEGQAVQDPPAAEVHGQISARTAAPMTRCAPVIRISGPTLSPVMVPPLTINSSIGEYIGSARLAGPAR